MNQNQKKTLLTLLGILLILSIALVVILTVRRSRAQQAEEEAAAREAASVITAQEAAYTALSYDNGSTALSFIQEEGRWLWADDPEFPLDSSAVDNIIHLLTSLKPQQTITEGDTLEAYGLDQPSASLTATEPDGTVLTIALGKTTTDGKSYYMLMNGDESTVYIIADTLYTYLATPIYDMMDLPELPALTEERIQSVSIEGTVSTLLRPLSQGEEISWSAGGEDVTGDADTASLLAEVEALHFAKCMDYKPTEEAVALCGFDDPSAEITVHYLSETGTEEALTLAFGSQTLDGTGYYVRQKDDTTIYQMDTASVDSLLAAAESGLGAG